ncbi:alpha/beta hydrolase [Bifidobacterium thermacidophilum]|uniref:Hydrolase, alpha/beta domain protein n=1 Tax=Bifidobacterium thermacidophilum subsp. thermacidophilum TaxID=79262 RepID=A0A087E269_9BIFI|nr:alpha/beta hydrolase [Bifidobacterium thermacidophilum]KFJ01870.1 hydrolase, alpha/beta domain protein [Bifidobacterium thermacidophilum subsp. thermacidophilum]
MSDTGQPPVSSIPDNAAATGNTYAAVLSDSALAARTASSPMASSSKDPQASYSYVDPWKPDSVLEGYQQATVHLGEDAEGEIVATFVRKDPSKLTLQERWRRWHFSVRGHRLAIMYVHGWNDYFYRRHASEYWESLGIPFYAVDLRKFGRSYRPYQTPGYIEDLHEYRLEFNALRDQIVKEQGKDVRILMIAHSQGGLSASLWVNTEHPHHVEALALNSPWLELQGNRMFRLLSTPVVQMYRLRGGKTVMPMRDPGFYARCIKRSTGGEWDYLDHPLNPGVEFLTRAGWMQAIYNGQDEIAKNLDIQIPVLVCTSDKSMMLQSTWDEGMREADSVLDITAIRQAALHLGDVVALATIRGGLHDLSMSKPDARRKYFRIVTMWASMMAWRRVIPTKWVDEALAKF